MAISVKDKDILKKLVQVYSTFSVLKDSDAIHKDYFKYSVEEAEETVQKIVNQESADKPVKKRAIREEVQIIDNVEMAKQFYLEHLVYNKEETGAKQECLKKISLEELKLVYKKIYNTEAKSRITKEELLSLIEKYFNGIDRALSMKP